MAASVLESVCLRKLVAHRVALLVTGVATNAASARLFVGHGVASHACHHSSHRSGTVLRWRVAIKGAGAERKLQRDMCALMLPDRSKPRAQESNSTCLLGLMYQLDDVRTLSKVAWVCVA